MIELALHYAAQGWPVFPLAPKDKVPLKGSHGWKDATTSARTIETWWARHPEANIGIATGKPSGLLVLDIDVKKGKPGIASWRSLQAPQTFTVATPTGGFHCYFRLPPGSGITTGADLLPGVDWRGSGGYVVAAGSVTPQGMYSIVRRDAIADLPGAIIGLLTKAKKRAPIQPGNGAVIAEGARDDTLIRIAGAIRRFGVEAPALLEALRAVNREHCRPPLEDHDLQRIAESAARYPVAAS